MKLKQLILSFCMVLLMATGSVWAGDMVNINSATVAELQQVNGFGVKIAQRIVAYRAEHGAFGSVDGLLHVKGIGHKRLANVKSAIMVEAEVVKE
ncbi:MAG: helix-hairpin-helix domain-containing protein [Mariprofundus sp.]|nr:helix-hairpin-helix domain-containing protein [Mariprofundus sp.]